MAKNYLNEKQEAERLRMRPRQLQELRLDGRIPYIRVSRKTVLYDPEATDRALAKLGRKVGAAK